MPSTRPTTRIQRRAEPFDPRKRNARANAMGPSEENPPVSPTVTAAIVPSESSRFISAAATQQIASAVSSAVVASLRVVQESAANTGPQQEIQELPLVAGGISEADATVYRPVASVLDSLTGERHQMHVASPVSNILNFNSISIPIDAQVNPKLMTKI